MKKSDSPAHSQIKQALQFENISQFKKSSQDRQCSSIAEFDITSAYQTLLKKSAPPLIPIQKIEDELLTRNSVSLSVMRLDLIDAIGSGNKFFKLHEHLERIKQLKPRAVLSFGGAYSNHIHALAFYAKQLNVKSIAALRMDEGAPLTPTLKDAQSWGMEFECLTRSDYRKRYEADFLTQLKTKIKSKLANNSSPKKKDNAHTLAQCSDDDIYVIAEGAADDVGFLGSQLMGLYIAKQLCAEQQNFDYLALACGTSSSFCGLLAGFYHYLDLAAAENINIQQPNYALPEKILALPILKTKYFRQQLDHGLENVAQVICASKNQVEANYLSWHIDENAHYGGYAKSNTQLENFAQRMLAQDLRLDPVYNAKLMMRLFEMIEQKKIAAGCRVLAIHSGGLQGCRGSPLWPVGYPVIK